MDQPTLLLFLILGILVLLLLLHIVLRMVEVSVKLVKGVVGEADQEMFLLLARPSSTMGFTFYKSHCRPGQPASKTYLCWPGSWAGR